MLQVQADRPPNIQLLSGGKNTAEQNSQDLYMRGLLNSQSAPVVQKAAQTNSKKPYCKENCPIWQHWSQDQPRSHGTAAVVFTLKTVAVAASHSLHFSYQRMNHSYLVYSFFCLAFQTFGHICCRTAQLITICCSAIPVFASKTSACVRRCESHDLLPFWPLCCCDSLSYMTLGAYLVKCGEPEAITRQNITSKSFSCLFTFPNKGVYFIHFTLLLISQHRWWSSVGGGKQSIQLHHIMRCFFF